MVAESLSKWNIPYKYAPYLVHNYGRQTDIILDSLPGISGDDPEWRLLSSELEFCLDQEMVSKPLDFIERRTGRLYFWIGTIERYHDKILQVFKERLKWSTDLFDIERNTIQKALYNSRNFVKKS